MGTPSAARCSRPKSGPEHRSRRAPPARARGPPFAPLGRCVRRSSGPLSTRPSITLCVVPVQTDSLASRIRDVPDFPKPGILFKDITTLLKDGDAFTAAIDGLLAKIGAKKIDAVVGMESRGVIFAAPIPYNRGVGFVPVRKVGKLPGAGGSVAYDLESGPASLELP